MLTGTSLRLGASIATIGATIVLARCIADVFDDRELPVTALTALLALIAVRALLTSLSGPVLATGAARLTARLRRVALGTAIADRSGLAAASTIGPGIDALDDHLIGFVPVRIGAAIVPILVLGVIVIIDPLTALVLVFAGPMLVLLLALIGLRTRELVARRISHLDWLGSTYLDLVRGLPTLEVHGRANEMADTVRTSSERFATTTMDVLRTAFQTSLVIEWGATASTALVAVEIAFRLAGGHLGFPAALTVLMLIPEFFVPWRELAARYHLGLHGEQVLDDLGASPQTPLPSLDRTGEPLTGRAPVVELHGISHTHPGADHPTLIDVSLSIGAGEIVAVTGPSGVGKSTLAAILLGLIEPDRGTISIDGEPLRADGVRMQQMAWVPQRASCFSGTIRDNVRLGRADASDEDVLEALDVACALDLVRALPEGLDTPLGEGARRLSAGQRQRLAIARAVVSQRPIEVLDECTALLDPDTEREVLRRVLGRGRTTLLIAHRPASIACADRVIELRPVDLGASR